VLKLHINHEADRFFMRREPIFKKELATRTLNNIQEARGGGEETTFNPSREDKTE
jgi:hypothetical protein